MKFQTVDSTDLMDMAAAVNKALSQAQVSADDQSCCSCSRAPPFVRVQLREAINFRGDAAKAVQAAELAARWISLADFGEPDTEVTATAAPAAGVPNKYCCCLSASQGQRLEETLVVSNGGVRAASQWYRGHCGVLSLCPNICLDLLVIWGYHAFCAFFWPRELPTIVVTLSRDVTLPTPSAAAPASAPQFVEPAAAAAGSSAGAGQPRKAQSDKKDDSVASGVLGSLQRSLGWGKRT